MVQEVNNQDLPYNEWIDDVFELIKTQLNNDGEMVLVVSKTEKTFNNKKEN